MKCVRSLISESYHLLSKKFKIKMHKTIILPVLLYGCETWLLTLKEDDGISFMITIC
jgi:hypothetical protein